MAESISTKIGDLVVLKAELMHQRRLLVDKISELKIESNSLFRQIREINHEITYLQQLPKQFNLIDRNTKKGKTND